MFRFLRTGLGKVVLGVVVVGLGAASALAVTQLTAGATAAQVDHFLCYSATSPPPAVAPGFVVPPGVRLINQFAPNGFVPKVGSVDLHCNPVQKIASTGNAKVTNPNAHLLCWNLSGTTRQASRIVKVTNQFGTGELKTAAPNQLCAPSWKSLTGPPKKAVAQPPALSHFTCYPVTAVPGTAPFKPPAAVRLKDQFAPKPVAVKVGAPVLLCLPTAKILPTGKSYPILNAKTHLLCFAVSTTPIKNPVYDQNQFGTGKVNIRRSRLLCLPSTKVVIH
jgi:hypothetical protein